MASSWTGWQHTTHSSAVHQPACPGSGTWYSIAISRTSSGRELPSPALLGPGLCSCKLLLSHDPGPPGEALLTHS